MSKQKLIEKAVLKLNGEFQQGDEGDDWLYQFSSGRYVTGESGGVNPHAICSREEFNAAADRMRGKPDWKNAPEWAQWLGQCFNGKWEWYQKKPSADNDCFDHGTGRGCQSGAGGKVIGDWRNTLEQRPEHIGDTNEKVDPAPAKPWFEAGELPAIGCFVDVVGFVVYGIGEKDCEVVAHVENCAVIRMSYGLGCFQAECLKPSMTDKEKALDAADLAIHQYSAGADIRTELLGALYDAGLLRLPDNKKPD